MLKKTITYEGFDGTSYTEEFYFNLSQLEILELEIGQKSGLMEAMQQMIEAEDNKALFEIIKKVILGSYGQKSLDGKRFIKNDELRTAFEQTTAFETLIFELLSDAKAAADFFNGLVPEKVRKEMEAQQQKQSASESPALTAVGPVEAPPATEEKNPMEMTREELLEAFRKKSSGE